MNALRFVASWLPIVVFFRQLFGASATFMPVAGNARSPLTALISFGFIGLLVGGPPDELNPWLVVTGSVGLLGALALFEWARFSVSGRYFSYVFSDDTPAFLHTDGPYAYIRNPFYSSYLLSMWSTATMLPAAHRWLIGIAACVYFWRAAVFEEGKFARSPLAGEYEAYKRRTGRFIPRRRPRSPD